MKTSLITILFCLGFFSLSLAEINPVTISQRYTAKTGNESITAYGDGLLGINHNYSYDDYRDYDDKFGKKRLEMILYDSSFKVIRKLNFPKIYRWNVRVEISKDANSLMIVYQPARWNKMVAGGTVKLFCLDKNLTCVNSCKFILPGSRPSIYDLEKVSRNHVMVYGNFANRGNYFLYNVDLASKKLTKFKLPKKHDFYGVSHFSQDNKTFVISRDYDFADSTVLSTYTNSGVLLKRQEIYINDEYPVNGIEMCRAGKNKYLFYGTGYNNTKEDGHRAYLFAMLLDGGKITKTAVINQSIMDLNARNDFSKVGLLPSAEKLRSTFETNRKKINNYRMHINLVSAQMFTGKHYYLFAGVRMRELEGGVLVELDENLQPVRNSVFPVVESHTVEPGKYKAAYGKCFFNLNGFHYAYSIQGSISGIRIDNEGGLSNFSFDTNTGIALSVAKNGFVSVNMVYESGEEGNEVYTTHVQRIEVK